jgi:hypothetical protein
LYKYKYKYSTSTVAGGPTADRRIFPRSSEGRNPSTTSCSRVTDDNRPNDFSSALVPSHGVGQKPGVGCQKNFYSVNMVLVRTVPQHTFLQGFCLLSTVEIDMVLYRYCTGTVLLVHINRTTTDRVQVLLVLVRTVQHSTVLRTVQGTVLYW